MKKSSLMLFAVITVFLLSGCSAGRYVQNSHNNMGINTQVVLSQANYRIVKTVSTTVNYQNKHYKFDEEQMKQSAYAALLRKADLTGSQALINVTMETLQNVKFVGPHIIKEDNLLQVTGTVIEFIK